MPPAHPPLPCAAAASRTQPPGLWFPEAMHATSTNFPTCSACCRRRRGQISRSGRRGRPGSPPPRLRRVSSPCLEPPAARPSPPPIGLAAAAPRLWWRRSTTRSCCPTCCSSTGTPSRRAPSTSSWWGPAGGASCREGLPARRHGGAAVCVRVCVCGGAPAGKGAKTCCGGSWCVARWPVRMCRSSLVCKHTRAAAAYMHPHARTRLRTHAGRRTYKMRTYR